MHIYILKKFEVVVEHVLGDTVAVVFDVEGDVVEHEYHRNQFADGQMPKEGEHLSVCVLMVRGSTEQARELPDLGSAVLPAEVSDSEVESASVQIDRLYAEIARLNAQRALNPTAAGLEAQIDRCFAQLRKLQEREAAVIQQRYLSALTMPIDMGATLLREVEEILGATPE